MKPQPQPPVSHALTQHPESEAKKSAKKPKAKRPGCTCDCGTCPCGPNAKTHDPAQEPPTEQDKA